MCQNFFRILFFLVLVGASCFYSTSWAQGFGWGLGNPKALRKASITPKDVEQMMYYNRLFSPNDSVQVEGSKHWISLKKGKRKTILLVAPHAHAHWREDRIKPADSGTGALALFLAEHCEVSVLYTSQQAPSDPNYNQYNAFKDSLAKVLSTEKPLLVLDLHTSHAFRPYDVDLGTLNGKSYKHQTTRLRSLIASFKRNGLTNVSKDFFSAEQHETITKFVVQNGFSCLQLEINSVYLNPNKSDIHAHQTAQLLQALVEFIDEIER